MIHELKRTWEGAIIVSFHVISEFFLGEVRKMTTYFNQENRSPGRYSNPDLIRSRNANQSTAKFSYSPFTQDLESASIPLNSLATPTGGHSLLRVSDERGLTSWLPSIPPGNTHVLTPSPIVNGTFVFRLCYICSCNNFLTCY
jgi:hypothetical protein